MKKILWVSNSPNGPASEILGVNYPGSSGGWIQSEYEYLDKSEYKMYFLCTMPSVSKKKYLHKENAIGEAYCIHTPKIPYGIRNPNYMEKQVNEIIDQIHPDIIQIWGTETCLSNVVSKYKKEKSKIIFLQGMLGIHQRYLGGYFGRFKDERKCFRGISPFAKFRTGLKRKLFVKQAAIEADTIRNCKMVIADNNFSRAYCDSLAPDIRCFQHLLKPNRIFFENQWSWRACNRFSVFTIFGGSADKGLQQLLRAINIVKVEYPEVKVLIPGIYHLDANNRLNPSKANMYETILYNLIKDYNLQDNVCFLGHLNPTQMAENLISANAFVNPSCMEVHALSLREALAVGTPCVSSLCGSVVEYVHHGENGLIYRYEEYELLAYYIKDIFKSKEVAEKLSFGAINTMKNMCFDENQSLNEIYELLLNRDL